MNKGTEQRDCQKFCFKTRKSATETYDLSKTTFGDKYLGRLNAIT